MGKTLMFSMGRQSISLSEKTTIFLVRNVKMKVQEYLSKHCLVVDGFMVGFESIIDRFSNSRKNLSNFSIQNW